jgi:hypothetical protein
MPGFHAARIQGRSFSVAVKLTVKAHRGEGDNRAVCDNANFLAGPESMCRKPFAV